MQIDSEFTVSVPIEQAWAVLTDLPGIAPCMPGAMLTGVEGDVYSGKVKVKVGPVTSEYAGTATFAEKDDAGYRAVIDARGRDTRGAGNASATITAHLRPDGDRTVVTVSTDLKISGRIAQFGSGMIKEVSAKLLGQFVANLEAKLSAGAAESMAAAVPAADAAAPASVGAPSAPGTAPSAAAGAGVGTAVGSGAASASAGHEPAGGGAGAVGVPAAAEEPPALDLMSVAGSSIYKRVAPLLVVLIVLIIVIIYFAVR